VIHRLSIHFFGLGGPLVYHLWGRPLGEVAPVRGRSPHHHNPQTNDNCARPDKSLCSPFSHRVSEVERLYGRDPPADLFTDYARRVSEQIAAVWPRCAALGLDVVLDLNFWSRGERDEARARAAAMGAPARLYRLACSDEEAWRRIEKRNARSDGGLFIARSTFELLKARFEALDPDEERVEIGGEAG
jgi:predicted kinase